MSRELRQEDLNARDEVANVFPEEFYHRHLPIDGKPNELQPIEMVMLAKKGGHITIGQRTPMRISQAKKDAAIWRAIERYYDAWKANVDAPIDGTALASWGGVTREEIKRLQQLQVRSVEDVARMNDADIERYGMGGVGLRQRAKAFVEAKKDRDTLKLEVDAQLADRDKQIEELRRTVEELAANQKKTPGRRAKADAEAA